MDPRSHPSRPPSTSLPPGSTPMSSTPISSMHMPQYSMQPQYPVSQPHTLPPLQPHHPQSPAPHHYMGQPYRPDLSRYPPSTHDVYGASQAPMMPHTTVGASAVPPTSECSSARIHHSELSSADCSGTPRDRRPDFNGLPSGAFSYSDGKGWGMTPDVNGANGSPYAKEPPRTQVVGSQGRRGILPSVPGRATPVTNGVNGTAKSTTIPAKDADGKFPCPHCNKTYLHAKHLKRHLLRHTGDRPYMCVLCKDTFSRSDILKRHFQKCSIRRGNPTGATHLSHPQAHLKRSQQQAAAAAAANPPKPLQDEVSNPVPHSNGVMGTQFDGAVNGNGMATGRPGYTEQQPLGFTMQSVNGMNRGPGDDAFSAGQAHARASWMAAPKQNPYLMQPGVDAHGQQLTGDRPLEQHGSSDGYINPVFPHSMAAGQEPIHAPVDHDRKFYPASTGPESGMNGLYLASTTMSGDGTVQPARQ
ncbi:uncharacterized protein N7479_003690 [Penicillium vulpinum]|uniref:uncharacterized protein n=1 Tax=Penicillium vulpinum TaxID=29845 RepID=UPI002548B40B|nr:uncharacterized protein N7479_003690 [Penicillium vulpinum]KAJ5963814.1 hypothetical protein N7479_003690 [Penicillium vulpinum]